MIICLPFISLAQENDWQLKKDSEGILIYTRAAENSDINEFKAYTKIGSSSETIFDIILDVENYPKWIEDVDSAKKLYQRKNEIGMYYQVTMPWPIKDRDITLVSKFSTLPDNSIHFHLNNSGDLLAEQDGFIRIKEISGQWLIKPIDSSSAEVTYQFLADPEGSLPAWVVNGFIVDGPFKTLQNLKGYAKTHATNK